MWDILEDLLFGRCCSIAACLPSEFSTPCLGAVTLIGIKTYVWTIPHFVGMAIMAILGPFWLVWRNFPLHDWWNRWCSGLGRAGGCSGKNSDKTFVVIKYIWYMCWISVLMWISSFLFGKLLEARRRIQRQSFGGEEGLQVHAVVVFAGRDLCCLAKWDFHLRPSNEAGQPWESSISVVFWEEQVDFPCYCGLVVLEKLQFCWPFGLTKWQLKLTLHI